MGEKKKTNNSSKVMQGMSIATVLLPIVTPAINAVADKIGEAIDDRKKLIAVPQLYLKNYPLTAEQASEILNSCGLKATIILTQPCEANPKLRNCFAGQVIGSEPKANCKVAPGRAISIKCATQEVIDESLRLYEEEKARALSAKEQRTERIEHTKTAVIEAAGKVKEIPILRKTGKKNLELSAGEEEKAEEAST